VSDALNIALLRVIAQDLRDYAGGELPATPEALRRLAMVLDDICVEALAQSRSMRL
jgi:hypothetical protein